MSYHLAKFTWCLVAAAWAFQCSASPAQELYPTYDRLLQEATIQAELRVTEEQMQHFRDAQAEVATFAKREYDQLELLRKDFLAIRTKASRWRNER